MQASHPADSTRSNLPVAVLGGGLSGLAVAYFLQSMGIPVVVLEASAKAGGAIRSVGIGNWLHEAGPNTLFEADPKVGAFIEGLGLASRCIVPPRESSRRFVVFEGNLKPLPGSAFQFARSPLFSLKGKLALAAEPFRDRAIEEESVASFVSRRLGREFLDRVVDPFVAGIFAGDPDRLSVRSAFPKLYALERDYGSLLRGSLAKRLYRTSPKGRMISFPQGLEEIPAALCLHLRSSIRLNTKVLALRRDASGWEVLTEALGSRRTLHAAAVISTLPAGVLSTIPIGDTSSLEVLAVLREVPHPPVASVFLGYRREDVAHPLNGFGFLVPKPERRKILGTLFSSALFAGRAPVDHVALTTFVGGTRNPELTSLSDDELARQVHLELGDLLGVSGKPVFIDIQRWPEAIPQYNMGHSLIESKCAQMESTHPGLLIGGNFLGGPSLAGCIESGKRLAERAAGFLRQ